jgi:predicted secreted protein
MRSLLCVVLAMLLVPAASAQARTLTEKADGKIVHIITGDPLTVRLTECTTCGYHWEYVKRPSKTVLTRTSDKHVSTTPPGSVGGSGKRVIKYFGRTGGKTVLKMNYVTPSGDIADTYTITIKVRVP